VRILPYGDAAVLFEPDDPALVLPLVAELAGRPGVAEVIPGARTVLVRAQPAAFGELARVAEAVARGPARPGADEPDSSEPVVLDVDYDGPDLRPTAAELGITAANLVDRHTAGTYVVAFCGFVPGFAYLTGLDPLLQVSRLAEPRTRVPAGAVGIAGEFTGVYPRASPGGWRLLGRTAAPLWDLARTPPALLAPGTEVRFRARRVAGP
jgi:KipI family sensor histidine kinase inhibitor